MATERLVRRGQIWWVDWEPHRGSEQAGRRPAVIIQSNIANEVEPYPNTIVLALSTKGRDDVPTHINVQPSKLNGLSSEGYVKCEQVFTIAKLRLDGYIGVLEPRYVNQVDEAMLDVLGLR